MAFADVTDLQSRLEWTLTSKEVSVAEEALEDLSLDAIEYGRSTWTDVKHPPAVRSIILRAAVRYMRNYEGLGESRAGDETMGWQEMSTEPGTPEFTKGEIRRIKRLAQNPSAGAVDVYTWGTRGAPEDLRAKMAKKDLPWIDASEREMYEKFWG